MSKEHQTALYLALDKKKIIVQGGKSPMSLPLADFTLLLSTTDEYGLLQPCRDRMKLLLRFQFYSEAELTEVLRHRSRALRWNVDEAVFPEITKRAKQTPRLALRLLQSCRRCARADGETTITLQHLHKACSLEQIDDFGLGPTETTYLQILTNGATRLNVIASILSLPSRTVSEVTEPFLIRAGLILKDDQGRRQLTQAGYDHVSKK
jgi:Holliday junction DNA helicase RuvB